MMLKLNVKLSKGNIFIGIFYSLLIVFFIKVLLDVDMSKLSQIDYRVSYLISAVFFGLMFRFLGVYIWINIISCIGCRGLPKYSVMTRVYAKAWMGRYIPGKVAMIAAKVVFGSRYGISKELLAIGSFLEAILQLLTSVVFSLILIMFDPRLSLHVSVPSWFLLLVATVLFLPMIPSVFKRLLALAYQILGKKTETSVLIDSRLMLTSGTLYGCAFFISGISYYFLISSFHEVPVENAIFIIAAVNLAGVIGVLALFAPGGLGVREGVLLVLLPVILPTEIAVLVVVITRVFSIMIDALFFVVCHLFPADIQTVRG